MRSSSLLSLATLFVSTAGLGYTPPPALVNTPNYLVYNAITLLVQQYAGTISTDAYNQLQSNLAQTPVASLGNVASVIALAFQSVAQSSVDSTLTASDQIQKCINVIVASNGSPNANFCTPQSKATFAAVISTFNSALHQYVGIVPPNTYSAIYQAGLKVVQQYDGAVEGSDKFITDLNLILLSVIAVSTQNTVVAIQSFETCVLAKFTLPSASCFLGPSPGNVAINSIVANIVFQFISVLPAIVVQDIDNILSYYFSLTSAVPAGTSIAAAQKHISLSLLSVVASTGSSTAAYVVQLQQCIANAIMVPTAECVGPVAINAPLMATTTIFQQFFGYLPASLIIDLENATLILLASSPEPTQTTIKAVFAKVLQTQVYGPVSSNCFLAMQDCAVNALIGGGTGCIVSAKTCTAILTSGSAGPSG